MKVDLNTISKRRWLITASHVFGCGFFGTAAVLAQAYDHTTTLAISCFTLGFLVFSMLAQKVVAKTIREAGEARDGFLAAQHVVRAAAEDMQRALQTGQIEVVPVRMEMCDEPTRH